MDYKAILQSQTLNAVKPGLKVYFTDLYSYLNSRLDRESSYLEIGSGAGISKIFLKNENIKRTDILSWPAGSVQGEVDAHELPFSDGQFKGVIGIDMLHHMPFPYKVIKEALRVTTDDGIIVFVEPYVSFLSYPIYKIFHNEKTSFRFEVSEAKPMVGNAPEDGNQTVCQRVFLSRQGKQILKHLTYDGFLVSIEYIHPLSFFLTGGLSRPLPTPAKLITICQRVERKLPRLLMKFISSRVVIQIQKN